MSYEFIRDRYGIDVPVNELVQNRYTGRYGRVRPETDANQLFVNVQYAGDAHMVTSHPEELDYSPAHGRRAS
jgi:hypothetical protein